MMHWFGNQTLLHNRIIVTLCAGANIPEEDMKNVASEGQENTGMERCSSWA
jgi:hypothetical protein